MGSNIDLSDLQKTFKTVPIMWGSDERLKIERLPLGIDSFDRAMNGGFAFGRTHLLTGSWSSGKSLISYFAIKSAQERGLDCYIVDTERSYDREWVKTLGVDPDKVVIALPRTGEQAWDIIEHLCLAGAGMVVLDSIEACMPTSEGNELMEKNLPADRARMTNKGLRKMTSANQKTCVILINQIRESVGVNYGSPEFLPGGKGQHFYNHMLLRVRRGDWILEGKGVYEARDKKKDKDRRKIGYHIKVKVEKSKLGEPWREGTVPFLFAGIVDTIAGLVPLSLDLEIIQQDGSYYIVGEERIHGKLALVEYVRENPEVQERLRSAIEEVPNF